MVIIIIFCLNSSDAMDFYYGFFWDVTMLEYLTCILWVLLRGYTLRPLVVFTGSERGFA